MPAKKKAESTSEKPKKTVRPPKTAQPPFGRAEDLYILDNPGASPAAIAKKLGRTTAAVAARRAELEATSHPVTSLSGEPDPGELKADMAKFRAMHGHMIAPVFPNGDPNG